MMSKDLCFKIIKKPSLNKVREFKDSYYEEVINYTFFLIRYLDFAEEFITKNCENLDDANFYISDRNIEKLIKISKQKIQEEKEEYNNEIMVEFIKYLENLKLQSHEVLTVNLDC